MMKAFQNDGCQNDGVPVKVLIKMSIKDLNNLVFSMKNAQTVIKIEDYDISKVKNWVYKKISHQEHRWKFTKMPLSDNNITLFE